MSEVKENVFLFVPNIIGFSRVILGIISLYYMPHNYMLAMVYYVISGLLDAVDGHAARYFNQSTKFGSLLDQVTDRVMTMCLLMQLSNFYPNYALFFQISNMIDIGGHWIYFFGSTIKGKSSHKSIDLNENCVLRLYYTSRTVLFTMCAANELFYVSLYLLHFTEGPYIHFVQSGLFRFLAIICGPLAMLKHAITIIQATAACIDIAAIDVSEREALKKSINRKEM